MLIVNTWSVKLGSSVARVGGSLGGRVAAFLFWFPDGNQMLKTHKSTTVRIKHNSFYSLGRWLRLPRGHLLLLSTVSFRFGIFINADGQVWPYTHGTGWESVSPAPEAKSQGAF